MDPHGPERVIVKVEESSGPTQTRWSGWAQEQYTHARAPEILLSAWEVQVYTAEQGWDTVSWCPTKGEAVTTSMHYISSGCVVRVVYNLSEG